MVLVAFSRLFLFAAATIPIAYCLFPIAFNPVIGFFANISPNQNPSTPNKEVFP